MWSSLALSSSSSGFGGDSEQFVTFWQPAPARALTERPAHVNYWLHLCSLACVWAEGGRGKNVENKHYRIPRKNVSYAPKNKKKTLQARIIRIIIYYIMYTSADAVYAALLCARESGWTTLGFFGKRMKYINYAYIDPIIFGVDVAPDCTRSAWCCSA